MLDSSKRKLIDAVVLGIAVLTVIGTSIAQSKRVSDIKYAVEANTAWRTKTETSLSEMSAAIERIDSNVNSAKHEIIERIDSPDSKTHKGTQ